MISYNLFELSNGLKVVHHQDESTQLCVLNILYNVGSKHENPEKTGLAHLFEHLMFGGSINIANFDSPLQQAGGESNAFTSNDITNYYLTLPASNIETGFWLESDRMLGLALNQKGLDIQKSVVIEEYKERYINAPYGNVWLNLLPLAYEVHPYRWPTIGKELEHIENATLDDISSFYKNFYCPNNAILVVAGNISLAETKSLSEKWFGPIPSQKTIIPTYKQEPKQNSPRSKTIKANVPFDLLVKAYHCVPRNHKDYYATDLLSDLLGAGRSSRLFHALVKEKNLFSELDCYLTGDIDSGLLVIEGKLIKGVSTGVADDAISAVLDDLILNGATPEELERIKNKAETSLSFGNIGVLNKAMKLAYAHNLGDISLVNKEIDYYSSVGLEEVNRVALSLLTPNNCSTLFYLSNQND